MCLTHRHTLHSMYSGKNLETEVLVEEKAGERVLQTEKSTTEQSEGNTETR